jgi:CubicO group peptidase (beta-lactamase class C family)
MTLKSKRFFKWLLGGVLIAIILVVGIAYYQLSKIAPIGTGFNAKIACSGVFVSDRDFEEVQTIDLGATASIPFTTRIDKARQTASSTLYGLFRQTAVYRQGLGCTLAVDISAQQLRQQRFSIPKPSKPALESEAWPLGEMTSPDLPSEIDEKKLKTAVEFAFVDPDPADPVHTRAVVAVYNGEIVAEKYADTYSKDTMLLGWSMTKSVTNALVGILVNQGKLNIYRTAPVPEWKQPDDPRSRITLDQLLRMSSGLKFVEEYESNITSDCNKMLFLEPDMGAFAASMPLAVNPEVRWSYSSGTANIISRIIRQTLGGSEQAYAFIQKQLFDRLGMRRAVIEPDAFGTMVGSSYMYATARDWARVGLLFLNDGVWQGRRILPKGWVAYSTTPTLKAPRGEYGAQFWLNAGTPGRPEDRNFPNLPTDLYYMSGHDGQMVAILPSSNLVIVRLGYTPRSVKTWDEERFLKNFVDAVGSAEPRNIHEDRGQETEDTPAVG